MPNLPVEVSRKRPSRERLRQAPPETTLRFLVSFSLMQNLVDQATNRVALGLLSGSYPLELERIDVFLDGEAYKLAEAFRRNGIQFHAVAHPGARARVTALGGPARQVPSGDLRLGHGQAHKGQVDVWCELA